jgi:hypothetical protein
MFPAGEMVVEQRLHLITRSQIANTARSLGHCVSMERHGRSRHTIPVNRAITHVPSAQPSAMKNPHTNQTNNALAEITGTIRHPPFDLAERSASGSCAI